MPRLDTSRPRSVSQIVRGMNARPSRSPHASAGAAKREAARSKVARDDGLVRETFTLPRDAARARARELLTRYPKEAYWTRVEHWRALPDGRIEFTLARLRSAD